MVVRIAICAPCAEGRCGACVDSKLPEGVERRCVCRHSEAPRAARRSRPPEALPQSAPFDLESALDEAREEGRQLGYNVGFMAGAAGQRVLSDEQRTIEAAAEPPEQLVVLVELDPKGGLVGVVAIGSLERCADEAWQFEPALPGHYVEAWMAGSDDPIRLPGQEAKS